MIDSRTIYPLDTEIIANSVKKTSRCVVIHEAPRTAGMGAEITIRGNKEAFLYLEAPVERVTGYDVPVPLFAREDAYAERIAMGIRRTLDYG